MQMILSQSVMRVFRFGIIGVAATATHAAVLWSLVDNEFLQASAATVVGFMTAFFVSYLGHYYFTFRSTQTHTRALPRFALTAVAGAGLNWLIFVVIVDTFVWHYWLAFLIAICTVPVLVFLLSNRLAFDPPVSAIPVSTHAPKVQFSLVFQHARLIGRVVAWGVPTCCFLATLAYTLCYYWSAPYADHWYLVKLFTALKDGQLAISDLFELHGSHWHASGYVVQLALAEMTDMGHWAECIANVVFAGLGFLAIVRMFNRCKSQLRVQADSLWACSAYGFCAFLYFSLDQAHNWLWGWQVAVFVSNAGALWTIEILSRGAPTVPNTIVAAVVGAVSVYGFGTGWILLPVGFGLMIAFGALRSKEGIVCLMLWMVYLVLLLYHFESMLTQRKEQYIGAVTPDVLDVETLVGLMQYATNFVAAPLITSNMQNSYLAIVVTVVGIGIVTWSIWTLRELEKENSCVLLSVAPFIALAVFAFGSGLLTALGRWEPYGADHGFISRHISFGTFFWVAVFAVVPLALAKGKAVSREWILAAAVVLFVLKVGNIPREMKVHIIHSGAINEASKLLSEKYPDVIPEEYNILHEPVQKKKIEGFVRTLWIHKVSVFAED